jgi:hypothetical protein
MTDMTQITLRLIVSFAVARLSNYKQIIFYLNAGLGHQPCGPGDWGHTGSECL